jgi:O-antigen/teichoic acid export membrane protein
MISPTGLIFTVAGTVLTAALGFLWQTLIGRILGPQGFGEVSSAFVAVAMAASLASLGTGGFLLNIFGKYGVRALRWFKVTLQLVTVSTSVTFFIVCAYALVGMNSTRETLLLYILLPLVPTQAATDLAYATAQLKRDYRKVAMLQVAANAMRFVALGLLLCITGFAKPTVVGVALCMGIAGVACFLFAATNLTTKRLLSLRNVQALRTSTSQNSATMLTLDIREVLRRSLPYAGVTLFNSIYYSIDIIMLAHMQPSKQSGHYVAAYYILSAAYLIPYNIVHRLLMPTVQKWSFHDPVRYRAVFVNVTLLLFVAGLLAAGLVYAVAGRLVSMCFGDEFIDAAALLKILAFAMPLHFATFSLGAVLMAGTFVKTKLLLLVACALLNVGLNLWLIPKYAAAGAAYATVITEIAFVVLLISTGRSIANWRPSNTRMKVPGA